MSPDTNEFVRRMYEALVEEIREKRPELLGESFTVAEIYQNLVPYRTHRDRIGTEMNGDYEDTLVRLLSGEGDYLELESDAARERLLEELQSVRPDTGIYRDFAACEVRLGIGGLVPGNGESAAPGEVAEEGGGSAGTGEAEIDEIPEERSPGWLDEVAVGPGGDEKPEPEEVFADFGDEAEPDGEEEAGGAEEPVGKGDDEEPTCRWCRQRLPVREDLRFCPFCGSRVDRVPCPECGTELEEGWLFCVSCGTEVES